MIHFWYFGKVPPPPFSVAELGAPPDAGFNYIACCCTRCGEIDLSADGGCPQCCRCIPAEMCLTLYHDDRSIDSARSNAVYQGYGGVYQGGFGVTITLDEQNCLWLVESADLMIDVAFDVRGENGIGCRSPEFPSIAGFYNTEPVQLSIRADPELLVPIEQGADGCWVNFCNQCELVECFPFCLCIEYEYGPTGLGDPEGDEDAFFRRLNGCWDAGEQAWIAAFEAVGCSPANEVRIELSRDESNNCELLLTTSDGGANRLPVHATSPAFTCFDETGLAGYWEYGNNSGTPGLPGVHIFAKRNECGDTEVPDPCFLCCQDRPVTLFADVINIDDCIDPEDLGLPWSPITINDVALTATCPNSHIWLGSFQIERCDDASPVTVELRVTCEFCTYNDANGVCEPVGVGGSCNKIEMKLATAPTWQLGEFVDGSCEPFYAEAELGGFHGQAVTIVVTESA